VKPIRRWPIAIATIGVAAALAWYADLPSAISIDRNAEHGDEPMLQSPATALHLLDDELNRLGGVPHDVRVLSFGPFTSASNGVAAYNVKLVPRDAIQFDDYIRARIAISPRETCLDGGTTIVRHGERSIEGPPCRSYRLDFPLRVVDLHRSWTPWPARVVRSWWERRFGRTIGVPSRVTTTCHGAVDVAAVRRVVAAIDAPLALKGGRSPWGMGSAYDSKHPWESALLVARNHPAAVAAWSPPYPTIPSGSYRSSSALGPGEPLELHDAVVADAPFDGREERAVIARFGVGGRAGTGVWGFLTTSGEAVCVPPLRFADANIPAAREHDWPSTVATALTRAESESAMRVWYRSSLSSSRVVETDRRPAGTSTIDVETIGPNDGRWRAHFTVDERVPAFVSAEFTRI
jgi:hypothetical protein